MIFNREKYFKFYPGISWQHYTIGLSEKTRTFWQNILSNQIKQCKEVTIKKKEINGTLGTQFNLGKLMFGKVV